MTDFIPTPIARLLIYSVLTVVVFRQSLREREDRERLAGELEAARTIQQILFTSAAPGIDAAYRPAAEVGGDFWQALPSATGGHVVVVGDVSGKGLKAAMVVSVMTGALRNRKSDRPQEILAKLNRVAASVLPTGFVTAIVAHVEGGQISLAHAGHPNPYLNGEELDMVPGLPLGIDLEAIYHERTIPLIGDLTIISDGVIEAANSQRELFGFERTRQMSGKSAQEISDAAQAWGQNDDITVVTVRRIG